MTFSLGAFASYDLVCSGKVTSTSPYPGAGGSVSKVLKIDLETMNGEFRESRIRGTDIEFSQVLRRQDSVKIDGITENGDLVNLELSIFGQRGPELKGTIGRKRISYKCNRNLILNL
tara:strand:- start:30 stop:380 length:351 start_codon:yes stop_codon:yes gene_type:complete